MTPERISDSSWRVIINPSWPGFAGHFPGDPVLPGALLVDQALHCLRDNGLSDFAISRARFLHPVRPRDEIIWTVTPRSISWIARAHVRDTAVCEVKISGR